jgi:hypothetical protein
MRRKSPVLTPHAISLQVGRYEHGVSTRGVTWLEQAGEGGASLPQNAIPCSTPNYRQLRPCSREFQFSSSSSPTTSTTSPRVFLSVRTSVPREEAAAVTRATGRGARRLLIAHLGPPPYSNMRTRRTAPTMHAHRTYLHEQHVAKCVGQLHATVLNDGQVSKRPSSAPPWGCRVPRTEARTS